jgi:chromate transporter
VFGRQIGGIPGAGAALFGLLVPGFAVITVFALLYARYGDLEALQRMFTGMAAAAAGLTISTGAKIAEPMPARVWTLRGAGHDRCRRHHALADLLGARHRGAGQCRACLVGEAMKADGGTLALLAGYFALMSLLAFDGGYATVPDMHRLAVEVMRWMSDRQFADLFAIAQVTPGPNIMIVTLIGYHVAGLPGAVVTTLAMCGPSCVVAYFVSKIWQRFKEARWQVAIQAGLAPIAIGLFGARPS